MVAFDELKRAAFGGVAFPIFEVQVRGGIRDHVHEYPHAPGGAIEKLGRKLYEIRMRGPFLNSLLPPQWATLWPGGLAALRRLFEQETTDDLVIPTIGTIKAYAVDWEQTMSAQIRSGEVCDFTFREDGSAQFLTDSIVQVTAASLASAASTFALESETIEPTPDIFDEIQNAANNVLAVGDQLELAGNLVEAKILGLVALLDAADRELGILNDPVNWKVLDALHELWASALRLQDDIGKTQARLLVWTAPKDMTITEVAAGIYGETEKATDLLKLNPIDDPFVIRAGTRLRYYEAA